jgi:hypothetical protein
LVSQSKITAKLSQIINIQLDFQVKVLLLKQNTAKLKTT